MAQPRGSNIESLRVQLGVKRSELAQRLGGSYAQIYNIERGYTSASIEFLYRLAAALNTDIDQVMVRTDKGAA
ncbi:MAG: helix-turn-helix domain-containing protein [Steroidobacteraceae bacterium]